MVLCTMNASIYTEIQGFSNAHKHTCIHQSRNSINIQGELILAWVCVSAALTSKRQRETEKERARKLVEKKQARESKKATMRDGKEEIEESKQWEL